MGLNTGSAKSEGEDTKELDDEEEDDEEYDEDGEDDEDEDGEDEDEPEFEWFVLFDNSLECC